MGESQPDDVEGLWTYNYYFEQLIGEGHVGKVYRAIDVAGEASKGRMSKEVVVKVYSGNSKDVAFKREVELMERVNGHPNVVSLLASHSVGKKGLVMPFYGETDLHDYIWRCNGLPEFTAAGVVRDLFFALQHVHGLGIIHRDVKPENMILGQDGRAVLLDFDVACYASDTVATMAFAGSAGYLAPEVIQRKPSTFLSDVFSVGCVVYFLISKRHPFLKVKGAKPKDIMDANEACIVDFGRSFKNTTVECRDFIMSLVVRDPGHRLSRQQAAAHRWLSCQEPVAEISGARNNFVSCAKASASSSARPMHFERVDSLTTAHGTSSNAGKTSRLVQPQRVCRNIVGKMSNAMNKLRGKASAVVPFDSVCGNPTEDLNDMTGILIRDD